MVPALIPPIRVEILLFFSGCSICKEAIYSSSHRTSSEKSKARSQSPTTMYIVSACSHWSKCCFFTSSDPHNFGLKSRFSSPPDNMITPRPVILKAAKDYRLTELTSRKPKVALSSDACLVSFHLIKSSLLKRHSTSPKW